MKLKTRLLTPLFAVLMLGTATSAFADLDCKVSTTPVVRAIVNGHWEITGDLTFTCTAPNANPTSDASFTVFYGGLPITNTTTLPADHAIGIAPGGTLPVVMDTTRVDTGTTGVNQSTSLVAMLLPAQAAPVAGTWTLRNVLLSLNGGTALGGAVVANINVLSPLGNVVISGGAPTVIIQNVTAMLNSTTSPPALLAPIVGEAAAPAQFTSTGTVPPANVACSTQSCRDARASFAMSVTEDHNDSWRDRISYYYNSTAGGAAGVTINGTNVLFTFAGMLPGSIISNCVLDPVPNMTWTLTGSGIAGTAGTTTFVAELIGMVAGVPPAIAPSLSTLDTLVVRCGTSTTNPAFLPGTSTGPATTPVTVDMRPFPIGVSNVPPAIGTNALLGGTPRYQTTGGIVGPLTVIQFGASAVGQTTMLIPYVLANVGTYDTGLVIANTTKDAVFGSDAQGAAPDTSGGITFNFYPGDGSAPFSITPTTGFNLVGGVIPSGNSFIGTLSNILKAGNNTAPFQGYVLAVANFTHAHGTAYVYGGSAADRLTSATDVLVIANPLGSARSSFGPTFTIPAVPAGGAFPGVTFTVNPVVGVEPTAK